MHLPGWLRWTFAAALLTFAFVPACSSSPTDDADATEVGTEESALTGCGHVGPGGIVVGRAPNACVPGSVDYTSAGCAQRNGRRPRTCGTDCLYKSFGSCECTPSCAGRVCGDDGCGGSCGTCSSGQSCDSSGKCFVPYSGGGSSGGSCAGKTCGPNGAGGSCGTCTGTSTCVAGNCTAPGPVCTANGASCVHDGQCCSSSCYAGTGSPTCVKCKPSTTLAYCLKDSECCSGLCDTYYVSCVSVCKHKTAACTNHAQCCSGTCAGGSCL